MSAVHRADRWGSGRADAPPALRQRSPEELALLKAAADRSVAVHFDSVARRNGRPHIHLFSRLGNLTVGLASFRDCGDALRWLTAGEVRR